MAEAIVRVLVDLNDASLGFRDRMSAFLGAHIPDVDEPTATIFELWAYTEQLIVDQQQQIRDLEDALEAFLPEPTDPPGKWSHDDLVFAGRYLSRRVRRRSAAILHPPQLGRQGGLPQKAHRPVVVSS